MAKGKSGSQFSVCEICNCRVKKSNMASHMQNVHESYSAADGPAGQGKAREWKRTKERRAEPAKKGKAKSTAMFDIAMIAILIVAVVAVGVFYYSTNSGNPPTGGNPQGGTPPQTPPTQTQSTVTILASELGTAVKFYPYSATVGSGSVTMVYFAAIGSDGKIHAALDACDVCYPQKKGYTQVGNVMKCNNCGKEFAINSMGADNLSGGCWPSFLPITMDGSNAVIEKSDLDSKAFMFA